MLLTTEEVKRMAKIMISSYSKPGLKEIDHVTAQLQCLPDAIRVNFGDVNIYLIEIVSNQNKGEHLRNKTLTMQLLIDTGLNAFAAELLAESFDVLKKELKERLPSELKFVIGNCEITLKERND
jgi:hypothetical protein